MPMNVDIFTTSNLPSPDSVGKGGVVFNGSILRVSDGDNWITTQTLPTGDTLVVTDADALTVGGVKVQTTKSIPVELVAGSVDRWVFIADRAYEITGISEIHSVVGGAAAAVRFRKVTAATVAAPGAAVAAGITEITTALHDLTTTVNTSVSGTLSATATDYRLAVGDKIGADFSGTLTGLFGCATIHMKSI